MKNLKRIMALVLVLVVAFAVTGCHKKGEIAVTIGDIEFTSAYYMCALMNADSEAKTIINEKLAAEKENQTTDATSPEASETSEEVDYYSHKVEDKDYVEWVEETAMNSLKKIAAYKTFCKENELELDEETVTNAEAYAEYYWTSYGYSAYFEPNGVGQATYTQYSKDVYYSDLCFEKLYGAEGEKAIAAEDVKNKIYENFVIADILEASYTESMSKEEITNIKSRFEDYSDLLSKGSKTFEEVYINFNGEQEEQETTETESEEPQPKDKYANVIGAEGTGYESDYYEIIKELKVGETKIIELEDGSGILLVFKQDIQADEYYLDALDMNGRHLIADKEYDKYLDDYAKELDTEINEYATKQFKVKKIKEPEYS